MEIVPWILKQSSFLVQPGAKPWLALSGQGPVLPLFKMVPLVGLLTAGVAFLLRSETPHNWTLTGEGFTRSRLLTSFGAAPLLIITWEENHHGGENWRGDWRWPRQTLSCFRWRKKGADRGCIPCLGHALSVSVSQICFHSFHTYSSVSFSWGRLLL